MNPRFAHRRAVLLALAAGAGACVATEPGVSISEIPGATPLPTASAKRTVAETPTSTSSASVSATTIASASASSAPTSPRVTATASTEANAVASVTVQPKPTPGSWAEHPSTVPSNYNYCFYSPPAGCPARGSPKLQEWTYANITKGPVTGRVANNVVCCYQGYSRAIPGRPISVSNEAGERQVIATLCIVGAWV
ncbi:MAG: hypothetical protein U0165_05070 [Polyangiaceae bacterium]